MSKRYKKWRELLIDPFTIDFKNIELKEIISYLPAGNDVLECICNYKGKESNLFIKIERSKVADFKNENKILQYLVNSNFSSLIPKVIEYGQVEGKDYLVLEPKVGERLSEIFKRNTNCKKELLNEYGKSLGEIHKILLTKDIEIAKQRIINDYPKKEIYKEFDEFTSNIISYLASNKPNITYDTFIHGDYHYANILWENKNISGILDFEYSGAGFKEQDIAWAIVLRPTQYFMDNLEDIKYFLTGYLESNNFDVESLRWCLVNAYVHFYLMNKDNKEYIKKVTRLIKEILEFDFGVE